MEQRAKILVKAQALGARAALARSTWAACLLLCACGQRGPLTLPNDNDFKQRATLPDIVRRQLPDFSSTPNSAPSQGAAPAAPNAVPAKPAAPVPAEPARPAAPTPQAAPQTAPQAAPMR